MMASKPKRIYESVRWRKLRACKLRNEPLCRVCKKPANEVDHILPVREHPHLAWVWDNLQSLCGYCHRSKTGNKEHIVGCDEAGMPLDGSHWWNEKSLRAEGNEPSLALENIVSSIGLEQWESADLAQGQKRL